MVSLEAANGKPLMVMKRVGFHGNDLESVEKLNALSRRICAETPDPSVAAQWLDETLKGRRHYSVPVYYLGNFCAAAGFCPVFGGTLRDSLFAGLLGLIIGFCLAPDGQARDEPVFQHHRRGIRHGGAGVSRRGLPSGRLYRLCHHRHLNDLGPRPSHHDLHARHHLRRYELRHQPHRAGASSRRSPSRSARRRHGASRLAYTG